MKKNTLTNVKKTIQCSLVSDLYPQRFKNIVQKIIVYSKEYPVVQKSDKFVNPLLILFSLSIIFSILICGSSIYFTNAKDSNISKTYNILSQKIPITNQSIAFVEPTFTYAAYSYNSFYNFYDKYSPLLDYKLNVTIDKDLHLLNDRPIPHGPFPYYSHPGYLDIPYKDYFDKIYAHVKKFDKNIVNISDADVNDAKIFLKNGSNAFNILFLFHNEYVTQSEYNNLKQFVYNGGTIVFTEANIFFAEVSYNKKNDSISLVDGHYWKFNGKKAENSVSERWLDENKEWMGSNFLDIPSNLIVKFRNNPFNYTHSEEQYVTNNNAKILIDYQVYDIPEDYKSKYPNPIVATYEMNYGKGKILNLGIWGHLLTNNKTFLDYFDNTLMTIAFGRQ